MPLTPISNTTKVEKPTDVPKFGVVVDNNDPDKLGKIKVNIPGIYEGDTDNLPWIRRKQDTLFCGNDAEVFDVPSIGSIVEVKWPYDDENPTYSGAVTSKKHTSNLFTNNYPYEGGFRFGEMYIKFDKGTNLMTISNGKTFIQCDPMGNITLTASGSLELNSARDCVINAPNTCVNGNLNVAGSIYSEQGASGTIALSTMATVSGGIITGCD